MTDGPDHDEQSRRALRDLERVNQTSEVVGTSAFRRAAQGTLDHFSASDAEGGEWAELWGRRIGRALSAVVIVILVVHLVTTYILP